LPLIRSYSIEFYYSVSVARTPGALPTLARETRRPSYCACLAAAALRAPATAYGNGVYGTAGTDTVFTKTATETDTETAT